MVMAMLTATQEITGIPDKLFFKIGEVCDLVGVQAHVLRYWESEFPMLQPQKNRAGQRTYRRKDVEMALRIKALLYDEGFTIAGAKKKLQSEGRMTGRFKVVPPGATAADFEPAPPPPSIQVGQEVQPSGQVNVTATIGSPLSRDALHRVKLMLEDMLTTLNRNVID
jgi:DNA-binding transcriptional MerR regulator